MNRKMQAIVNEFREDGHTKQEIMDALCDGEFLSTINATQDEAEDAHDELSRSEEYLIIEKQNTSSIREENGRYFGTLVGAKQYASRNRTFLGTVLVIENTARMELAWKRGSKWTNNEFFV